MAGSCIGVVLLVMVLEALRRASREYDAYLLHQHVSSAPPLESAVPVASDSDSDQKHRTLVHSTPAPAVQRRFRPSLLQQLIRSVLHMLQFAVAYFIMLLAMYFNGYIIISILIGALLGAFVFGWHSVGLP